MRLFGGVWSGYTQKVRIALAEKGLTAAVPEEIVPIEEKQGAVHRARNPLGLVPVLELDDGSYLPESTVIIEYLEALHPTPALFPRDPLLRARMHVLDRHNDQALTGPVRTYWAAVRHPGSTSDEDRDRARDAIYDVYRYLDAMVGNGPYLTGEQFTVADIAFMQRLQLLPMLGIEIPPTFTRMRAWERRLRERPSWDATRYPPLPDAEPWVDPTKP